MHGGIPPNTADPNYLLLLITSGTAIVVAIITGFGAAALKHRWDVAADRLRWHRERSERRRDELRSAFASYFASRSSLERAMFIAARDRNVASTLIALVSPEGGLTASQAALDAQHAALASSEVVFQAQADYFRSLAELQIILDDRSFVAMKGEIDSFGKWLHETFGAMSNGEYTFTPPPDSQSMVQLAQKLIRD
jgi:hypothetical protein